MAVRIRLTRVGATKQPTYRLVVADQRSAREKVPRHTHATSLGSKMLRFFGNSI